jgi:hypothetical protein
LTGHGKEADALFFLQFEHARCSAGVAGSIINRTGILEKLRDMVADG